MRLNCYAIPSGPLEQTAVRVSEKCCRGDLGGKKALAVCVIQGGRERGREGRERAREKQTVRERQKERETEGVTGWRQVLLLENRPLGCASGCNTDASMLMRVLWPQL